MGKSSVSYRQNGIGFQKAREFYCAPATEASSVELFETKTRPRFDKVIDIEEFDTNEYAFRFQDGQFFVVDGWKAFHWPFRKKQGIEKVLNEYYTRT